MTKQYTGSCYIGVVGADFESGECRDSIGLILHRPRDEGPYFARATKGYEARQTHLNKWFNETKHPFILLLDQDMRFEPDTLERLRSHGLPYVSGLYMRRRYSPLAPVWYRPYTGKWPLEPWVGVPERGKLHPIGASGWGCVLLHREVVEAVRLLLKGEWDIFEDDMDIYPYDLGAIMTAIRGLRAIVDGKPDPLVAFPALEAHLTTLETEIRPLRADREVVGSDIRYPFFAKQAGYQLVGDPDVRPAHMIDYPLSANDYDQASPDDVAEVYKETRKSVLQQRRRLQGQKTGLFGGAA